MSDFTLVLTRHFGFVEKVFYVCEGTYDYCKEKQSELFGGSIYLDPKGLEWFACLFKSDDILLSVLFENQRR